MNSANPSIRATIPLTSMTVELELPAGTVVLEPARVEPAADVEDAIARALAEPIGTPSFSELLRQKLAARPDATAVIVVSDSTRPVPYTGKSGILWPLVDELLTGGFRPEKVSVLIASGTHRRLADAEMRTMLDGRVEQAGVAVRCHDAFDHAGLRPLGVTSAGTRVTIDRGYLEADFRILTGLVETHFMAGASGGRKSICPGLLGIDSIREFHGPTILADPRSTDLATTGNPCHELSLEIARMAPADFILNVTARGDGAVVGAFTGDMERAHEAAVQNLRGFAEIPIHEHYDVIVAHAGKVGVNHYQAAKAASAAAKAVKQGGYVILLADTVDPDPVGSDHYRGMMTLLRDIGPAAFDRLIRSSEWTFVPDQWEVQMWARFFDRVPPCNFFYFSPQTPSLNTHVCPAGSRSRGRRSWRGFLPKSRWRYSSDGRPRPRWRSLWQMERPPRRSPSFRRAHTAYRSRSPVDTRPEWQAGSPGGARSGGPTAADVLLLEAFTAALSAVTPERVVPPALPDPPQGRTIVVGAGKASAAMALAVQRHWPGELSGLVVVPRGYRVECETIEVVEAAHPVPDGFGFAAADRLIRLVTDLGPDDLVVALFSGGGSALLPLPAGSVGMEDKRSLITQLLRAGANIGEINCLRKHLSAIKGGRLACAAYPAAVANILISDVAGDDPAIIASGPTVPDPSSLADAIRVIEKYRLQASPEVLAHLGRPGNETPKPGDPCFDRVSTRIVASAQALLEAAAAFLEKKGVPSLILSDSVEGESRQVALVHAAIARQVAKHCQPIPGPCALLSGGETTVTMRGDGQGGSNMEFLLALVIALRDSIPYAAIACDTDGSDGSSGIAGAVSRSDSWRRAEGLGLDPRRMLDNNDSRSFFAALGDLVDTGPTFNNVNDFRALLVLGSEECDSAR